MSSSHRLRLRASFAEVLLALRTEPGLFALVGAWAGVDAIVGWRPSRRLAVSEDPFSAVVLDDRPSEQVRFGGGWVGSFGYRLGHLVERLPPDPPRPVPTPDFTLAHYERALVLRSDGWWIEHLQDDMSAVAVEEEERRLMAALAGSGGRRPFVCGRFLAAPDDAGHGDAVSATLEHLAVGDIYQANICRRLEAPFAGDPLDVFCRAVGRLKPRYAAFLRTDSGAIVSLSPELFLQRRGRQVRTSPIKGTAPLDGDVDALVASAKNRAENVMIVDLMRNDLGRVCTPGSVQVEDLARAEAHTGVWHLVSDVVGELDAHATDADLLRATFPPGSVTGAPKVAAMRLIAELETTARETYTGAIGYVSPVAGLELNVAIRTFEFADEQVWLGVGGGVVIDSRPAGEVAETLVKARPLLDAIGAELATAEPAADRPGDGDQRGAVVDPVVGLAARQIAAPPLDVDRGVFTTLLVRDGRPVDLEAHLDRLAASVEELYGDRLPPQLDAKVRAQAEATLTTQRLRVSIRPDAGSLQTTITVHPYCQPSTSLLQLQPVAVPGGLGSHKYADRRRIDGFDRPAARLLVLDDDGTVLESGTGNVFLVTEDAVRTPALDGRLLAGVTRQRAIEELRAASIPVREERLLLSDVRSASEVFVTGSLVRVQPVAEVEGLGTWRDGPIAEWLRRRLSAGPPDPSVPAGVGPAAGESATARLLIIDNYDSFVYNLDQYLRELGATTEVVRNDAATLAELEAAVQQGRYDGIVISPGPGRPADAGVSTEVVRRLGPLLPVLGVCLGHQCIAEAYGGRIVTAPAIRHGRQSLVHHIDAGVFRGIDAPLLVARYHSLVVEESSLPSAVEVTARTADGTVMGIRHREHPVEGVQFHPESVLTIRGRELLATFVARCAAGARV